MSGCNQPIWSLQSALGCSKVRSRNSSIVSWIVCLIHLIWVIAHQKHHHHHISPMMTSNISWTSTSLLITQSHIKIIVAKQAKVLAYIDTSLRTLTVLKFQKDFSLFMHVSFIFPFSLTWSSQPRGKNRVLISHFQKIPCSYLATYRSYMPGKYN